MKRIIDISRAVRSGAAVYPGDPEVRLERVAEIGAGSDFRLSEFSGPVHLLTHLDAPAHFVAGGETIDRVLLSRFFGRAVVVEIAGDVITEAAILEAVREAIRGGGGCGDGSGPAAGPGTGPAADLGELAGTNILFKTRHSGAPLPVLFDEEHVHLTLEAAEFLVRAKINLVGIDYLDIEAPGTPGPLGAPGDTGYPVHRVLLGAGILILEGLDLGEAAAGGEWMLAAFPLKLEGAEGAPCRAVLIEVEE